MLSEFESQNSDGFEFFQRGRWPDSDVPLPAGKELCLCDSTEVQLRTSNAVDVCRHHVVTDSNCVSMRNSRQHAVCFARPFQHSCRAKMQTVRSLPQQYNLSLESDGSHRLNQTHPASSPLNSSHHN